MAKHSVQVLIKARDEASKKLKGIGLSAMNMSGMLKKAAAAAAVYFGARAMKRFVESSLEAYGRQEAAVESLRASLALLGKESQLRSMEKFAASIQKITKYGDEAVLELMAMGSAMGKLHGKTLKDSTKAAIGLSKAYTIELAGAMRLVARAAVGDTSTLTKYGIKLEEGLSKQEKFNKVLEIGTRNFKLAEAEADTYTSAVERMKNAVGDVKEKIGEAIAPMVKKMADNIREWAQKNQEAIGLWAKKVMVGVEVVTDIFKSFVDYMKKDFKAGMKAAFDSFIEILMAAFKTAIHMAIKAGEGIINGLFGSMINATKVRLRAEELYKAAGGKMKEQYFSGPGGPIPMRTAVDEKLMAEKRAQARREIEQEKVESLMTGMKETITQIWEDAAQNIMTNLPAELQDSVRLALARGRKRLAALTAGAAGGGAGSGDAVAAAIMRGVSPALRFREARFLTRQPGERLEPEKKIMENTKKTYEVLLEMKKAQAAYYKETFRKSGLTPHQQIGFAAIRL